MLGVVHVPVFTSLKPSEYEFIQQNCGARMVIVSDKKLFKCVSPALENYIKEGRLFTFDEVEGARCWLEIIRKGEACPEAGRREAESIRDQITPEDISTLIYTSGTTGSPKGVMLSHINLVTNFISDSCVFNLKPSAKYLSILPLCHVGGGLATTNPELRHKIIMRKVWDRLRQYGGNLSLTFLMQCPGSSKKFYDVIISKGKKLTGLKRLFSSGLLISEQNTILLVKTDLSMKPNWQLPTNCNSVNGVRLWA